jgi:GTPase SAR1 family protein
MSTGQGEHMLAELGLGLIGDLINTGLKRGVSVAFQKFNRLQRIDHAMRGVAVKNPHIVSAVADFETVIGGYHGQLNTALDSFIRELSRSGIIEAMVENALVDRKSDDTKTIFLSMYHRFIVDPAGGEDLYDKMFAAFKVTLKELTKDSVLYDLIQSSHKDLIARLDRTDIALKAIAIDTSQRPESDLDLSSGLAKMARALQLSYKTVRVETNRGARDVEINRIYIPPKLRLRSSQANKRRISNLLRADRNGRSSGRRGAGGYYFSADAMSDLDYQGFTSSFRRAVVLGDPGGGKSTLCQKLCYDLAKGYSLSSAYRNEQRIPTSEQRIPIRVVLRKFEQARTTDKQLDLLTYIARDIVHYAGGDTSEIKRTLHEALETGLAVLVFDGLDEILDTSMRQDFVDLVVGFCNRYPLCPALVSSRLVGYDDARLPDEFEEVVLKKFEDDEVEAYLIKFMKVVGGKTAPEAADLAKRFTSQTIDTASDLRRNPLLLGLRGRSEIKVSDISALA